LPNSSRLEKSHASDLCIFQIPFDQGTSRSNRIAYCHLQAAGNI